jgi:putative glutamine amidotransferase
MTEKPRIAIPAPNSTRPEYVDRALPQYEHAVREAGGEPVVIPVNATPSEIAQAIKQCDGVLLPGSPADVDPEKYGEERHEKTAPSDPFRDNTDELLLQDAYNMRKPVLGICYGLQSLNVWRTGTLEQDLPEGVNHRAGRAIADAHRVQIEPHSTLAAILRDGEALPDSAPLVVSVNSSHHQAAASLGDGLRLVAWCPEDEVKEAVEGTSPDHFVLGVQWHPERDFDESAASKAIFAGFVRAAAAWHRQLPNRQSDFESVRQ